MTILFSEETVVCYNLKKNCCICCNKPHNQGAAANYVPYGSNAHKHASSFRICNFCMGSLDRTNETTMRMDCNFLIFNNKIYSVEVFTEGS